MRSIPGSGPIKLVAMADAYERRLRSSYESLSKSVGAKMDVPEDRRFVGFDAYKKAMDCLKPGDVAIFATPPAFRWVHFQYAIEKETPCLHGEARHGGRPDQQADAPVGRRSHCQKPEDRRWAHVPPCPSAPGTAKAHPGRRNRRHYPDARLSHAERQVGWAPNPANISELDYQVQRFHSFIWASGGIYSDNYIHIIDHLCWMKNAWPIKAQALGGRHYKQSSSGMPYVDQNFDTYSVEYVFADGARMLFDGRHITGCQPIYSSYVHGTKGMAIASKSGDCGAPASLFKGPKPDALEYALGIQEQFQSLPERMG